MSSTTKYILLGVVIIALVAILGFLGRGDTQKGFDWRESYIETSKQPFGTHVVFTILKSYFPGKSFTELKNKVSVALPNPDSLTEMSNYIFIGDGFWADSTDTERLLHFIEKGNQAFIATNAAPQYFLKSIYKDSCEEGDDPYDNFEVTYKDSIWMNLDHPQLAEPQDVKYVFSIGGKNYNHDWAFMDTLRGSCTEGVKNFVPLGHFGDDRVNFARVKYGKGLVYLYSTPITLTNYFMLDSVKTRYISKLFSHLSAGPIYWDTKSKMPREYIHRMDGSNLRLQKDGPLKYILEQPALRWAWFIFLGLIGFYLIFRAKRRQRIIPILEDKSNTSLEFIQTIGNMYFQQGNHIQLCDTMLKQFQTFVREKYHLASRDMNEEFVKTVALKSDIPQERIQRIVNYEDLIYRNSITEQSMVEFYHLLNNFYKTCK